MGGAPAPDGLDGRGGRDGGCADHGGEAAFPRPDGVTAFRCPPWERRRRVGVSAHRPVRAQRREKALGAEPAGSRRGGLTGAGGPGETGLANIAYLSKIEN